MPVAALAIQALVQYGIPFAVSAFERWNKEEPNNPAVSDWLALLKSHPSLSKTYDQHIADAEKRNS